MSSTYYVTEETAPRPQTDILVDRPGSIDHDRAQTEARSQVKPFQPYEVETPYTGGKVKALLVGINYTGTANQLEGCVNDVRTMLNMLETIDFPIQEAAVLVDDPSFPNVNDKPTRGNMIRYMAWLTDGAKDGDVLFFHYSGHGARTKATKDTEEEYDSCLVPMNYLEDGTILDDDLFLELIKNLPDGVRMTVVFDCCHSASMLDLPFQFVGSSSVTETGSYNMKQVRQDNFSAADVLLFSGCTDEGTSADVQASSGAGGAATAAFTWCVENEHGANYMDVIIKTREALVNKGFTQVPQLSCSKPLDLNKPFSLFGDLTLDEKQFEEQVPEDFRKKHPIRRQPRHRDGIPPRFRHHMMDNFDPEALKNGFVPPERRKRFPPPPRGGVDQRRLPPQLQRGGMQAVGRGRGGPGMVRGGRGGPEMNGRGGRGGPEMEGRGGRGGRGGDDDEEPTMESLEVTDANNRDITVPDLSKKRFMVDGSLTVHQFIRMLIRTIGDEIGGEDVHFIVGKEVLLANDTYTVEDLYKHYKNDDEFLYVRYTTEAPRRRQEHKGQYAESRSRESRQKESRKAIETGRIPVIVEKMSE